MIDIFIPSPLFTLTWFYLPQSYNAYISDIAPRPCKYVIRDAFPVQIGNNYG